MHLKCNTPTQKLNWENRGHRSSVYLYITSWTNCRTTTVEPAFLWGKTVPKGWGTARGGKGESCVIIQYYLDKKTFTSVTSGYLSYLRPNLRSTYTVVRRSTEVKYLEGGQAKKLGNCFISMHYLDTFSWAKPRSFYLTPHFPLFQNDFWIKNWFLPWVTLCASFRTHLPNVLMKRYQNMSLLAE